MKKFNTAILFIALCVSMVSFFEITSATKNLESNLQQKQAIIQAQHLAETPRPLPARTPEQKLDELQSLDKSSIENDSLYIAGILFK